ncbi:hypothetical protein Nepgr_009181 [Nepenthes gracilis]|uniref:GIR1-like zinc ribbon domain-containing protein n=1 Tax=Nepenthes gracilis TaxID=150966 RepID=A0AAD3SAV2_NEPGR|nr:hypothetical protein Nepgr_009181 [Nepenthes gracilis]
MSRRNNTQNRELDLKLNLSPPRASGQVTSPEASPPRSCLSSEDSLKYSSSPESSSMVLVGCPRCLMYVMLSESDPKCPKCKSTVLLDFLREDINKKARN